MEANIRNKVLAAAWGAADAHRYDHRFPVNSTKQDLYLRLRRSADMYMDRLQAAVGDSLVCSDERELFTNEFVRILMQGW